MEPRSIDVITGPDQAVVALQRTRRQLLAHLAEPDSAAGLARRLGLPRQRLNYHLRELEREGLVELIEERRKGNCVERVVRATARAFVISPDALGELGATPGEAEDRFSSTYLVSAAARAMRDVAALQAGAKRAGKRLSTFTLETDIRFASADARARFAEELAAAAARLAAKYHDERAPQGRRFRLLAAIHPVLERKP
jgi:DNA-binding transcriptional ArsR family regulator